MDKKTAEAAVDLAVSKLQEFIKSTGPIGVASLDAAGALIQAAIAEAYVTRFDAKSIEFVTVPREK